MGQQSEGGMYAAHPARGMLMVFNLRLPLYSGARAACSGMQSLQHAHCSVCSLNTHSILTMDGQASAEQQQAIIQQVSREPWSCWCSVNFKSSPCGHQQSAFRSPCSCVLFYYLLSPRKQVRSNGRQIHVYGVWFNIDTVSSASAAHRT